MHWCWEEDLKKTDVSAALALSGPLVPVHVFAARWMRLRDTEEVSRARTCLS
jgi:hypothetical protein